MSKVLVVTLASNPLIPTLSSGAVHAKIILPSSTGHDENSTCACTKAEVAGARAKPRARFDDVLQLVEVCEVLAQDGFPHVTGDRGIKLYHFN